MERCGAISSMSTSGWMFDSITGMRLATALAIAAMPLLAQHAKDGEKPKHPFIGDPVATDAGKTLFRNGCAGCHGPEGEGGRGPNLRERVFWHPTEDDTLFSAIRKGIGIMPASTLPDDDVWRIVAFVRSLTSPAFEIKTTGDFAAGETLFWGSAGCAGCHRIKGKGGMKGPDLSNVGLTSTVPNLRQSIVEPDEVIAEGYQHVALVMRNGEKLDGVARNRSNYSLQLQLPDGRLRLIDVGQMEQMTLHKATAMPLDYGKKLNRTDVDNLVAYLAKQAAGAPTVAAQR